MTEPIEIAAIRIPRIDQYTFASRQDHWIVDVDALERKGNDSNNESREQVTNCRRLSISTPGMDSRNLVSSGLRCPCRPLASFQMLIWRLSP